MFSSRFNIYFLLLISLVALDLSAQSEDYVISAIATGGYSYHITEVESFDLNVHSFVGNLKLEWRPEHMLSGGLETGYYPMYSLDEKRVFTRFGFTNLNTSLTAIPIMLFFSMELYDGLKITGSLGGSILTSKMDSFGNRVETSTYSNAFGLGISYEIPINSYFAVRTDARWIGLAKTKDDLLSVQAGIKYLFLKY